MGFAAYEDTGLEPEEVMGLCEMGRRAKMADLLRLEEYQALGPIDHLQELVQAEKESWLGVPLNIGQKVWFLLLDLPYYYPETNGWYLSEETVTAIAVRGFSIDEIDDDFCCGVSIIPFDEIGKTAFLTREEAEAALEAQKGESHETDL